MANNGEIYTYKGIECLMKSKRSNSDGISWIDMDKISSDKNFLVQWTRYLGQYSKVIINGRVMKDEDNIESSVSII